MAKRMVQTMIGELLTWSDEVIGSVNAEYSPNIHLDGLHSLNDSESKRDFYTIRDLSEIFCEFLSSIKIDHQIYRVSLGIQLGDGKTPKPIRNLDRAYSIKLSTIHVSPFFQISLRNLDLLTELDEVYKVPVAITRIANFRFKVLFAFEARIRAIDIEDGDNSFSRRLIIEPVIE